MTERERLHLKGPVRSVETRRHRASGDVEKETHNFTIRGDVASVVARGGAGVASQLKTRTSEEPQVFHEFVGSQASWSCDELHGVAFGTNGAAVARTVRGSTGTPVETIFEDNEGQEVARLRYSANPDGRVLRVTQTLCVLGAGVRVDGADSSVSPSRGGEFNVTFCYDDVGHVVEWTVRMGHELVVETRLTYNNHGDLETFQEGDRSCRFLYEYDDRGNWTRRVRHNGDSAVYEERRTFTYFDELMPER